ncbi:peptidoglycan editing factor PgeF [Pseudoxanthomonas sangjuensis]|uniref:peptidoglycan editing factor PgeF n=1 Tax=Pseudoxanthomonas sangjuensis TaxID=1503750 RepID=UPI001391CF32|nr:peptidoglycan editing factor PgeF [Pseudoxanthomonas sangjuensis]KAF1713253.1 multi-copper polyphenol oxidoreductase [Pseudoxanthomonas sangjuensis]
MSAAPDKGVLPADWPAPPGVHAFTTLRFGAGASEKPFDRFNLGLRSGDDVRAVQANRNELIDRFGLPGMPHWLQQVHGTDVVRADALRAREGQEPVADAAVTSNAGAVLAILTADCLPVVFAAKDGSEVGAAHAGWRGLAAGVLENTVAAMKTAPQDLVAWLGPAAGPQAYEIGREVFDAFVARDPRADAAFAPTRPGHWKVDLYALAKLRLADAGLAPDGVFGGTLCTIGDARRFFSHRRSTADGSGRTGRMATLVWRDA